MSTPERCCHLYVCDHTIRIGLKAEHVFYRYISILFLIQGTMEIAAATAMCVSSPVRCCHLYVCDHTIMIGLKAGLVYYGNSSCYCYVCVHSCKVLPPICVVTMRL